MSNTYMLPAGGGCTTAATLCDADSPDDCSELTRETRRGPSGVASGSSQSGVVQGVKRTPSVMARSGLALPTQLGGLGADGLWAAAGLSILAVPTLLMIARESWSDEQAQQGPFILILGGWLLWRRWPVMREAGRPGSLIVSLLAFALSAAAYVVGRVAALFLVEAYALYAFGLAALYALMGLGGLRKAAFPLFFLAFAAPVPFAVGWPITVALRLWISELTVRVLQVFDVTATRDGLTLFIADYRIEMEQACSGMNSLLALSALSLCYIHLRRDPPVWYITMLLPLIVMFAVVANFVRVLLLSVMTLALGDGLAQGWLHQTLGFATFLVALMLTFATDALLSPLLDRRGGK